jgi:hypothetical protein
VGFLLESQVTMVTPAAPSYMALLASLAVKHSARTMWSGPG